MAKRTATSKQATIRTLFLAEQLEVLRRVRRAIKGLRMRELFYVLLIGDHSGWTLSQLARAAKLDRSNLRVVLLRVTTAGWIVRNGNGYYLTERGQIAYDLLCKEFEATWKLLIAEMTRRVSVKIK